MEMNLRWKQRFENFDKALQTLHKASVAFANDKQNELYRIALIGSFSFTFELAWKTLKDYLYYSGVDLNLPREIIKHSYSSNLIKNGQIWIDMLDERNLMSHVYDQKLSSIACNSIVDIYIKEIEQVHNLLQSKMSE